MPIQKFHCVLCGHGYGDITDAVKCEQKVHASIIKPINNHHQDTIVKVEEKYADLGSFPSHLIVTLKGGDIIDYSKTFEGKELK
jgi:hypothetical protein